MAAKPRGPHGSGPPKVPGPELPGADLQGVVAGLSPNEALEALRRARRGEAARQPPPKAPTAAPTTLVPTNPPQAADAQAPADPTAEISPEALSIAGHLDLCNSSLVEGWLAWVHLPKLKIRLEIFDGDRPLGECVANRPRDDLAKAGYGEGRCAFSFMIPFEARVSDPSKLRLRIANTPLFLVQDSATLRTVL